MQQQKAARRIREQRRIHREERREAFKYLVVLPLSSVVFFAAGLLMAIGALGSQESGDFGFGLMVLGLGVGSLSPSVIRYLEYFEERASRRSPTFDAHESGRNIVEVSQPILPQDVPAVGERRKRRNGTRALQPSRLISLAIIPPLVAAACWALGVGFMLFGYGPDHLIGGIRVAPVWAVALLVWGGLVLLGITVLVRRAREQREK